MEKEEKLFSEAADGPAGSTPIPGPVGNGPAPAAGEHEPSLESPANADAFSFHFFHPSEPDPGVGPAAPVSRWAVTWSGLMMILFILFAVLYIYESGNQRFPARDPRPQGGGDPADSAVSPGNDLQNTVREIYETTRQALQEGGTGDRTGVDQVGGKAVIVNLSNDLLFGPGTADFLPDAPEVLDRVAGVIRKTNALVNVAGHTDSNPFHSDRFETNWELSASRACAVARYFIERSGIRGERLFSSGHAQYQPKVPNTSVGNRAVNNRVEIIIWL